MPELPFISVVMPTKNRRRFIKQGIRFFLEQRWDARAELIIVEDGDEECSDLCGNTWYEDVNGGRSYNQWRPTPSGGARHTRVRYFRHEGTLGAKLNFGVSLALGELIANQDDDDWYAPDRLMLQYQHMQMTGKAVVGCCSGLFWDGETPEAFEYQGMSTYAFGGSFLCRRDWALKHPHADVTLGEDDVFAKIAAADGQLSTMSCLPAIVLRNHPGNTSPMRDFRNPTVREALLLSQNWRQVPFSRVEAIVNR